MAMQIIPIIELSRYSPGMVTALGVSMGLTARAIMSQGTIAQKERWALALLTLEKIGAWAITEPGSGSDAFGAMKSTARRDGDGYVLNGSKTFITNGPYADTIVFICKLDEGNASRSTARCSASSSTRACPGLDAEQAAAQDGPARRRRPASCSSRTCASARTACSARPRSSRRAPAPKETFTAERTGVAAMALGIVEQCLELCDRLREARACSSASPIGEFQLIQLKLAKMEVARMNIQNLVFRQIEMAGAGRVDEPRRGVGVQALLRRRRRWTSASRPCSSSAATATWPSTRSSSSAATPRCCRSTAAPTRSRSRRSRAASKATPRRKASAR